MLYQNNTQYSYNVETKKCVKTTIDEPWLYFGDFPNETFRNLKLKMVTFILYLFLFLYGTRWKC
jgi:hypothetical protein